MGRQKGDGHFHAHKKVEEVSLETTIVTLTNHFKINIDVSTDSDGEVQVDDM